TTKKGEISIKKIEQLVLLSELDICKRANRALTQKSDSKKKDKKDAKSRMENWKKVRESKSDSDDSEKEAETEQSESSESESEVEEPKQKQKSKGTRAVSESVGRKNLSSTKFKKFQEYKTRP